MTDDPDSRHDLDRLMKVVEHEARTRSQQEFWSHLLRTFLGGVVPAGVAAAVGLLGSTFPTDNLSSSTSALAAAGVAILGVLVGVAMQRTLRKEQSPNQKQLRALRDNVTTRMQELQAARKVAAQ